MWDFVDKLIEANVAQINRKQQSITRLFPTFFDRTKKVASMGGLKLHNININTWYFKVHSGTKSDVWYDNILYFVNVVPLLSKLVKDQRLWIADGSRIDRSKLARQFLDQVDIKLSCSCPAALYWGSDYILSLNKYQAKYGDPETRSPRIRNPKQYGIMCKHMHNVLRVLPFYVTTITKWLTQFYNKDIAGFEAEAKKELSKYKVVGAELGKKKKEIEKDRHPVFAKESKLGEREVWNLEQFWITPKGKIIDKKEVSHWEDAKQIFKKRGIKYDVDIGLTIFGKEMGYIRAESVSSDKGIELNFDIIAPKVTQAQVRTMFNLSKDCDLIVWSKGKIEKTGNWGKFISFLRKNELIESKLIYEIKIPKMLRHSTGVENIDSIKKHGLIAVPDEVFEEDTTPGVNFSVREGEYTFRRHGGCSVKVDTSGLDQSKFLYLGSGWYRYLGNVAPKHIKSIDKLIDEEIIEAVSGDQKIVKDFYKGKSKKLTLSTWGTEKEGNWFKFLLLTDGTIIPVVYSHKKTIDDTGLTVGTAFMGTGAVAGYIDNITKEMGIGTEKSKLTKVQIFILKNLYLEYSVKKVVVSLGNKKYWRSDVKSSDHLDYLLMYGPDKDVEEKAKKLEEDLANISDPKLKQLFIGDKIEDLEVKIRSLERLAKTLDKGSIQSSLYVKIDDYQREIALLKKSLE